MWFHLQDVVANALMNMQLLKTETFGAYFVVNEAVSPVQLYKTRTIKLIVVKDTDNLSSAGTSLSGLLPLFIKSSNTSLCPAEMIS